ncbi:peptide MFS transporter [Congregibacter litoralis]|uniref:Amino acid/peptide transporter (Peptide:H+ symporter), bacterial n=1 Tax=Congregibacter litoralis KT71 TaxID=314285 RepID=A4AAA9_9GAMM|nr:oligopeptide:H+ symporter [Congregibacter litoralis]EAQ96986.2 amino acid/peptide transporter (Peptide:H+ symporter), bacterial [Congregibacter litoralis KT71]
MSTAVADAPIVRDNHGFFGHPRGLMICFATEMWERFSFYGMKYLLLLYLTKYHLFTDAEGLEVLGGYAALVYAMPVIGGLIADRYLGMRKSVILGGLLLVAGHLGMAVEGEQARMVGDSIQRDTRALQVFYASLALIVIGVGFLKPNISTIVGQLYSKDDPRRDSGFTIFYMGINLGSFSATLLCGYLGETYGWGYGFGAAGIGMLLGLATFIYGQRYLAGLAEPPEGGNLQQRTALGLSREHSIYVGALVGVVAVWQMLQFHAAVGLLLNSLSLIVLSGLAWFIVARCDAVERSRTIVLIILTMSTVVFWALFEQSAASMTLFADRVMDREVFGLTLTASQYGALNSMFIFMFAPFFAWLWTSLGRRGLEPSTPVKFALGIAQAGLGFGALVLGAANPDQAGLVSGYWMVLAYLLHTCGELCLSPVGLSAVTKLAVPSVVGVMMGSWFLATAYSEFVAAQLAKLAALETSGGSITDTAAALASYGDLFTSLFWLGVGVGGVMLLLSPLLRRMMHGIH